MLNKILDIIQRSGVERSNLPDDAAIRSGCVPCLVSSCIAYQHAFSCARRRDYGMNRSSIRFRREDSAGNKIMFLQLNASPQQPPPTFIFSPLPKQHCVHMVFDHTIL